MKCQFFSVLWHSWMMQRAGMMNAEQFRLTDTFREFISFSHSQDKRALELSYHLFLRGFTVLPATPFTLLYKAFILIYWLWSFKNNCIWRKSAGERKSRVALNNLLTLDLGLHSPQPVCFVFGISSFLASSAIPLYYITNVVSHKGDMQSPMPGYSFFMAKGEV